MFYCCDLFSDECAEIGNEDSIILKKLKLWFLSSFCCIFQCYVPRPTWAESYQLFNPGENLVQKEEPSILHLDHRG